MQIFSIGYENSASEKELSLNKRNLRNTIDVESCFETDDEHVAKKKIIKLNSRSYKRVASAIIRRQEQPFNKDTEDDPVELSFLEAKL